MIVVSIILTGVTYFTHKYQVRRSAPLVLKLAREALDEGKLGEAAQFYMRYLKLEPQSAEALGEFGELAARVGNVEGTYYQLSKSLRLNPEQSEIRQQVAELAVQLGRYADAKRILSGETSREFRNKPRQQWLRGVADQHLEEYDAAREYFEAAVEAAPNEPAYAKSFADLLSDHLSDAERGKQVLDRLVSEAPDDQEVYLIRGRWSYRRASKVTDPEAAQTILSSAWEDVEQAKRLGEVNPELAILAADVAIAKSTPDQARETVETAIAAKPKLPELYRVISDVERADNNRDVAVNWLNQGLTAIPDDPDLLWNLAELRFDEGDTEAVKDILKQLRNQSYDAAPIRLMEARMVENSGKFHEAADLIEESSAVFQRNPKVATQADYLLASCYRRLGYFDEQMAALRRIITRDPNWVPGREAWSHALLERGRLRESLSQFTLLVERPNPSVAARVGYARALFLDGLRQSGENWQWTELPDALETLDSIPAAATDAAIIRAEWLAAKGQLQEAKDLLQSQIENDTDSLLASRTLIKLLTEQKDWEEAESALKLMDQTSVDSPALRLDKAQYMVERYGEQAAEQPQFDQLAEPHSDWGEVQRAELAAGLVAVHFEIENYPACERFTRVVAESETYQPKLDYYLLLIDLALRSGKTESMTQALSDVRQFERAEPLVLIGDAVQLISEAKALGETNTVRRESLYDEAIANLTKAALARPTWPLIPLLKGDIYERLGQLELAVPNYLDAFNLGEKDTTLISRTALLLVEDEKFDEADEVIRKLQAQETPLSPEMMRLAAEVATQLENYERARDLADECVEKFGEAEDHLLLAEVCRLREELADAQREYKTAIEADPAIPDGWIALVEILAEQGDVAEARELIDEALESLPADVADDAIAQCYQAIKAYPEAEEHYLQAMQAASPSSSLIRRVADFYLSINKSAEAKPLLDQLLEEKTDAGQETSADDRRWARRKLALFYGLQPGTENFRRAKELIAANEQQGEPSLEDQRVLAIVHSRRPEIALRKKAISMLEDVISQQSEYSLDDNLILAELFDKTDDWENYKRTMRRLMDNGGAKNPVCVRYHATALIREGELDEARTWISKLNKLAPGVISTNIVVLEWLFQSEDYARLLATLQALGKEQANWRGAAGLAENFGTKLLRKEDESTAEPFLDLANKLYTEIAEVGQGPNGKLLLTAFQARQGKFDQAFERLSDPELPPDSHAEISQMALRSGRLSDEQAKRLLALTSKALEQHPKNEKLQLCVADLYSWIGSWSEATEAYKALLEDEPDSVPVLNNMAMMLAMSGQRLDVASRAINRAIAELGEVHYLLDTRGMVRLASAKPELAELDFRAAIETSDSVDHLFHLAQALLELGSMAEARSVFDQAKREGISKQSLHRQEWSAFDRLVENL